jgi:hypothetical protein
MNGHPDAIQWWLNATREDKARWLQCEAAPEEIDAALASTYPAVKEAAEVAAVGDAYIAFRLANP